MPRANTKIDRRPSQSRTQVIDGAGALPQTDKPKVRCRLIVMPSPEPKPRSLQQCAEGFIDLATRMEKQALRMKEIAESGRVPEELAKRLQVAAWKMAGHSLDINRGESAGKRNAHSAAF